MRRAWAAWCGWLDETCDRTELYGWCVLAFLVLMGLAGWLAN